MAAKELIQKLLDLQSAYASTYRSAATAERMKHVLSHFKDVDFLAEKNREPLIEHVGHLPIIASFLYPYIEHKKEINLGRVLIMLAIHDIGETVTGDILTFKKEKAHNLKESKVAKKILPKEYLPYYEEFELRESFDAKFAKAIDALAPDLHELSIPKVSKARFKALGFNSEIIEKKKTIYFVWDKTLAEIFKVIIKAHQNIELGKPTGFKTN
ncbi:MAG: HD domain-containing protein [Patescibacteria group bacterium]